ncbi:unnamed protein product, partial [marine sediment metagenome]
MAKKIDPRNVEMILQLLIDHVDKVDYLDEAKLEDIVSELMYNPLIRLSHSNMIKSYATKLMEGEPWKFFRFRYRDAFFHFH